MVSLHTVYCTQKCKITIKFEDHPHRVSKKCHPFYFYDNFVRCRPIRPIMGMIIGQSIYNVPAITYLLETYLNILWLFMYWYLNSIQILWKAKVYVKHLNTCKGSICYNTHMTIHSLCTVYIVPRLHGMVILTFDL